MVTERERRIYYQDIVYSVCGLLDTYYGGITQAGTVESPTNQVVDKLRGVLKEYAARKVDKTW